VVSYDYWEYFVKMVEAEDDSKMINFANYPALSIWYQLKNAPLASLSLQILSTIIFDLENLVQPNVVSTLTLPLFLEDYTSARLKILADFTEE
jgi:hypothetical protein